MNFGGNMSIIVEDDYDGMSKTAADIIAAQVNAKPDCVLGLATGGTPVGAYSLLAQACNDGSLDFSQVTTFNLDEYYPIQKTNCQSYDFFMKSNLFSRINVDISRVHIPNGEAEDPQAECEGYEASIAACGGIDLQLLGLGPNGHIGFNEPADSFSTATSLVSLTQSTISANRRFFQNEADVPRHALTMGIKTIMMARRILVIVSGEGKAGIVEHFLRGPVSPGVPASILRMHRDVTVVLDRAAASAL